MHFASLALFALLQIYTYFSEDLEKIGDGTVYLLQIQFNIKVHPKEVSNNVWTVSKDHVYRMVKERYSNIWPNQTIVFDQSELTILLCQPMNSLLQMKTTLPWYRSLQLLPSYIHDPWVYLTNITTLHTSPLLVDSCLIPQDNWNPLQSRLY